MTAQWFPQIERLTARLTIGITVLVLLPLTGGLYLLSRYQYAHTVAARQRAAELENRILEAALRHQMLRRDPQLMAEIFREVGRQPEVRRAMVVDHSGVVRFSSREPDIGVRLSQDSPSCLVCHDKEAQDRNRWVMLTESGIDILRSVLPIQNSPECHGCHDPRTKLNGILILDVSMSSIQAQVRSDVRRMAVAAALLTLVLIAGIGLHVRYAVLLRLARLGRAARSFASGALGERVKARGDDVIASLERDFNSMADATSSLIQEVKGREQQIAGVLNSLDDGLVVLDRDFRVIAANRSLARRLCAYPEGLQGRNCRDAIGHALPCREEADCPTARCLSTGTLQRATYRSSSLDGIASVHEVYASPVLDDDGTVAQVVEVWRDISERVREEEHLAEIERLSSLGVLASGLSHEVNTPLATTLTCSEAILDQLEGCDSGDIGPDTLASIRESAGIIRDEVMRCRTITEQFLRFARGIPPATEPIDLQQVVRGIMALARPTAREAGIELEMDCDGSVPVVTANTEVVQHVVLNVLVNAIESFTGPGGRVVVQIRAGSDVCVRVRDTGSGIPPEVQKHLFEPFRTQKPRGTGLGLFLSRTFMRRFNGDVRLLDSAVGRGSCIEIIFPRSDHEAT